MRKITAQAVQAFQNLKPFSSGNTTVTVTTTGAVLKLHGHTIAELQNNTLFVDSCGYMTATTKDRLNGIPGVQINQKNFQWFLNGTPWNGYRIQVQS